MGKLAHDFSYSLREHLLTDKTSNLKPRSLQDLCDFVGDEMEEFILSQYDISPKKKSIYPQPQKLSRS